MYAGLVLEESVLSLLLVVALDMSLWVWNRPISGSSVVLGLLAVDSASASRPNVRRARAYRAGWTGGRSGDGWGFDGGNTPDTAG